MKYLKLFEDRYDDVNVRKRLYTKMKKSAHRREMKNFEKVPAIQFENDYLKIHKITEGPNKGKILFKFNENNDTKWSSLSMVSGCAEILDTKYENIPEIRNVELSDNEKFRNVHGNTIDVVLQKFLTQMGYVSINKNIFDRFVSDVLWYRSEIMVNLKNLFTDKIKMCADSAKDLGEVTDLLKKVRDEVFEYQKDHYDDWELKRNITKYNL